MRLFLDLHVSGPVYARELRADGHDVFVGAEDPRYAGLADARLLRGAAAEDRVVITFDTDYARIAKAWAREGIEHGGVLLVVGIRSDAYRPVLEAVRRALAALPRQEAWRNLLIKTGRSSA